MLEDTGAAVGNIECAELSKVGNVFEPFLRPRRHRSTHNYNIKSGMRTAPAATPARARAESPGIKRRRNVR